MVLEVISGKVYKSNFHKIRQRCSASVLNIAINSLEVKVKVQGQNRRTDNISLAIARLWIKISSPNLAILQKYVCTVLSAF